MAQNSSFDIVSEVDMQEVDNAVNQATKEVSQRYDFKGSVAEIELSGEEINIRAENDFKLKSIHEILIAKCVKRGVPIKSLDFGKVERASGESVKQSVAIKRGIPKEKGREIVGLIKSSKIKIQAQIEDDKIRVSGKKKDDLQAVIQLLKEKDLGLELQFTNYRSS